MRSADENANSALTVRDEVASLIERTHTSSYQDVLNAQFVARILDTVVATAEQTDDYASIKMVIQQHIQDVEKCQAILHEILKQVDELEATQAEQERYSERWWLQRRKSLYEMFQSDPQRGLSYWVQTYAAVLMAWNLPRCEKLVNEQFPFPIQSFDVPALFKTGTQAIIDERYQQALDMLTYLVEVTSPDHSQHILDKTGQATLHVFIGRILLCKALDSETALKHFEQAKALAPDEGRSRSALGEYYRLKKEPDKALTFFQEAIKLSPKQADGYIGKGMLCEDQELWDEADDCYKEAIEAVEEEKDIEIALNKFLAPVSGNLYLLLARTLKKKQDLERALQAVIHAIDMGIKDQGEYPERLGYKLKGEILKDLERKTEAAELLYQAAQRYSWRNEYKIATDILRQANKLNPNYVSIYWELADDLRLSSYLTTPPYVVIDSINESLDTWKKGFDIKDPESDYALAYIVRALINEPLARMPDANRWALWWEAVAYIERAIILQETNSQYWSFLGQFYRLLNAEASALRATSRAIGYDPNNVNALDEHVANLANVGEFDAAEKALEKRQKLEESIWLKAVEAWILVRKDAYTEAWKILQSILKTAPDEVWYHDIQASCYLMLNEPLRAREEYEWIWNKYEPSNTDNLDNYAWAAYNLALFAKDSDSFSSLLKKAIEIFQNLCKKPTASGNTYRDLGLCYLVESELVLGEKLLDEGLVRANNAQELDDLLKFDLYTIEMFLDSLPNGIQVREVLDRFKGKIREKRTELVQLRSVEEELKEVIRKYPHEDGKINWAWIGAHAGLARFYSEEKRWSEAATMYLLLQKEDEQFPEARRGLEKSFDEIQAEAVAHMKVGRTREALEQLLQISKLALLPDDKERRAQLHSQLGYIYFDLKDSDSARKYFAKALQLYHENGSSSPGSALSEVCQAWLRNATKYWSLDAEWKAIEEELDTDEVLRDELIVARESLAKYLDEFYKLSEQYVDTSKLFPVVTPIILEIGAGLIPLDTSPEWSLFKSYIPEMRQRFQDKMGIKIPGISVRQSNILSSEGYLIKLDEAEIESGSVYLDMRYCPTSPETILASGLLQTDIKIKLHPVTGEPGCWISQDSWDTVMRNNLELWAEPLVFIIHHLEAIILRHLTHFMGTQDVEILLAEWEKNPNATALINSALPDEDAKYYFAQILRALVREQVPITSWKDILEAFKETEPINGDISSAVRAIRLQLKEQLPGNTPNAPHLELPMEWEDMFIAGLKDKDGRTFLTLPPKETFEFLSTIRGAVKARDWNLVLVTQSPEIRPFVRQLVEHEFPHLMVLAQDELVLDRVTDIEQTKGVVTDAE